MFRRQHHAERDQGKAEQGGEMGHFLEFSWAGGDAGCLTRIKPRRHFVIGVVVGRIFQGWRLRSLSGLRAASRRGEELRAPRSDPPRVMTSRQIRPNPKPNEAEKPVFPVALREL